MASQSLPFLPKKEAQGDMGTRLGSQASLSVKSQTPVA